MINSLGRSFIDYFIIDTSCGVFMINSLDHTFIDYFIIDPTEKEVGQSMAILRTGYVFGHDFLYLFWC